MTRFYIVRHSKRGNVKGDPSITNAGLKQTRYVANRLKRFPIKVVYSSPLKRSLRTAKEMTKMFGLRIRVDERLRERANWGDVSAQTLEEFVREWNYSSRHRKFKPKKGFSSFESGLRLESSIKEQSIKHPKEHLVLVTHGGVLSDLLRNILSKKEIYTLIKKDAYHLERLIPECSLTILDSNLTSRGKLTLVVRTFASTSHLPHGLK